MHERQQDPPRRAPVDIQTSDGWPYRPPTQVGTVTATAPPAPSARNGREGSARNPYAPAAPEAPPIAGPSRVGGSNAIQQPRQTNDASSSGVGRVSCTACTEEQPTRTMYRAPCSHHYCGDCVERMFRTAITEAGSWPPKCCNQNFRSQDAVRLLSPNLRADIAAKREELEDTHPVFCHSERCSAYIGPSRRDRVENTARCTKCQQKTCMSCGKKAHANSHRCSKDKGTEQVRDLAKKEGWMKCSRCKRIIERKSGCNHLT